MVVPDLALSFVIASLPIFILGLCIAAGSGLNNSTPNPATGPVLLVIFIVLWALTFIGLRRTKRRRGSDGGKPTDNKNEQLPGGSP
jgi:hypothetical protein